MNEIKLMYQIICISQVLMEKIEDLDEKNIFKINNIELIEKFHELVMDVAESTTDKLTDEQIKSYHYNTDRLRKLVERINLPKSL